MDSNQQKRTGNTILYLCENIRGMSKTKLLKLLYLLEERSVSETGTPFLNLDFEVWKLGPVAKEIFISIEDGKMSGENEWINNYIICRHHLFFLKKGTFLAPNNKFDDSEFSDFDIKLMDEIIKEFGNKSASELIAVTHCETRPWYKVAKENNLLGKFNAGTQSSSDCKIEFKDIISNDPQKLSRYDSYKEFSEFATNHHS
jgi:uncharacterized phage-associated protein